MAPIEEEYLRVKAQNEAERKQLLAAALAKYKRKRAEAWKKYFPGVRREKSRSENRDDARGRCFRMGLLWNLRRWRAKLASLQEFFKVSLEGFIIRIRAVLCGACLTGRRRTLEGKLHKMYVRRFQGQLVTFLA